MKSHVLQDIMVKKTKFATKNNSLAMLPNSRSVLDVANKFAKQTLVAHDYHWSIISIRNHLGRVVRKPVNFNPGLNVI